MGSVLPSSLDRLEQHEIHADYNAKTLGAFVKSTREAQGAELANAQSIFRELCAALKVKPPKLKSAGADNHYCFEADVVDAGKQRRMDVYLRGHFIFESKQGVDPGAKGAPKGPRGAGVRGTDAWRDRMTAGRLQVGRYAVAAVKRGDPKPPFIVLADLGHKVWIWSSWSKDPVDDYGDFEDDAGFAWDEIAKPELFRYLRLLFDKPEELNDEARGQRITAEIAEKISDLAKPLEKRAKPDVVGDFLMKCVFTMFAEDVNLLPPRMFSNLLEGWIADKKSGKGETFVRGLRALWKRMDTGGDLDTGERLRQFNGYLFKQHDPIDLTIPELEALREAARADWRKVSPAIFGTLLERALSPAERAKLGAHYTPEPYIRRLVEHTILGPLRAEWALVRAEMERARQTAKTVAEGRKKAVALGTAYRKKLATLRVLDPACGSGNFLYVTMRDLKRLEAEVERALLATGGYQRPLDFEGSSVHPVQFHGIELKPWAAKIAELVLWIGYLQWQTSAGRLGYMQDPLIKDLHHIEARDALIKWTMVRDLVDDDGAPVLRAAGVTDKKAARTMVPVREYQGVRVAAWPEADYIVGNPPFLGNKQMNDLLGAGYVDAIKAAFPDVNGSADLVMWWWWRAADLTAKGKVKRFGFVTTNSVTQPFDRVVVTEAVEKKGLRVTYAIPDHPWYDEGAAVRIAMTVATKDPEPAVLGRVADESRTRAADLEHVRVDEREVPEVHADLTSGANVTAALPLRANEGICFQGITLVGEGFRLDTSDLERLKVSPKAPVLKPYIIGRDLTQRHEVRWVIDFHGLTSEQAAAKYPTLFNHVVREVKPQRMKQNDAQRKSKWWLFGRSGVDLRAGLAGLQRYIATSRTATHRTFVFVDGATLPDTKVVAIASSDAALLGVLSSRVHALWADRAGGWLGVGNDSTYNHVDCFAKFPFPDLTKSQRESVAKLGEAIDAHRKARQRSDPELALTDLYNVLAKLRAGATLTVDDERVRTQGMVDTLRELHDTLDAAVLDAYGWSAQLSDDDLLAKLVELNARRAAEEQKGTVRWLRPEFQAPGAAVQIETVTSKVPKVKPPKAVARPRWPKSDPPKYALVVEVLAALHGSAPLEDILSAIEGAEINDVVNVLACLAAAQRTALVDDGDGPRWILRA